jgi:hypothetical protein
MGPNHFTLNDGGAVCGLYLGWSPSVLLINFQVDGASSNSGTIQGYFDELQIWRW